MATDSLRLAGDPRAEVSGRQITELFEIARPHGVRPLPHAVAKPDDADDATQATFVSAYKSLLGGSDVREPAAWLATIARNECGARARARMREPLPLLDADLGHIRWARVGAGAEGRGRRAAAGHRRAAQRNSAKRSCCAISTGYSTPRSSAVLGMSVASVESLLFRARRTLRVSLRPLATGALAVPVAVREGIAQAVPLFGGTGATGGGAVGGAAGLGLLAKLSGGPMVVKVAAGLAAVAAAGSAAAVGVEHSGSSSKPHGAALSPRSVKLALSSAGGGPVVAHAVDHTGREGKARWLLFRSPSGTGRPVASWPSLTRRYRPRRTTRTTARSSGKSAVGGGNSDRAATHDAGAARGHRDRARARHLTPTLAPVPVPARVRTGRRNLSRPATPPRTCSPRPRASRPRTPAGVSPTEPLVASAQRRAAAPMTCLRRLTGLTAAPSPAGARPSNRVRTKPQEGSVGPPTRACCDTATICVWVSGLDVREEGTAFLGWLRWSPY